MPALGLWSVQDDAEALVLMDNGLTATIAECHASSQMIGNLQAWWLWAICMALKQLSLGSFLR